MHRPGKEIGQGSVVRFGSASAVGRRTIRHARRRVGSEFVDAARDLHDLGRSEAHRTGRAPGLTVAIGSRHYLKGKPPTGFGSSSQCRPRGHAGGSSRRRSPGGGESSSAHPRHGQSCEKRPIKLASILGGGSPGRDRKRQPCVPAGQGVKWARPEDSDFIKAWPLNEDP
jgi:hypothetical protein